MRVKRTQRELWGVKWMTELNRRPPISLLVPVTHFPGDGADVNINSLHLSTHVNVYEGDVLEPRPQHHRDLWRYSDVGV